MPFGSVCSLTRNPQHPLTHSQLPYPSLLPQLDAGPGPLCSALWAGFANYKLSFGYRIYVCPTVCPRWPTHCPGSKGLQSFCLMRSHVCAEEGQLIGHRPAASLALPSSGSSPQPPWDPSRSLSRKPGTLPPRPALSPLVHVFPAQSGWLRVGIWRRGGQGNPVGMPVKALLLTTWSFRDLSRGAGAAIW